MINSCWAWEARQLLGIWMMTQVSCANMKWLDWENTRSGFGRPNIRKHNERQVNLKSLSFDVDEVLLNVLNSRRFKIDTNLSKCLVFQESSLLWYSLTLDGIEQRCEVLWSWICLNVTLLPAVPPNHGNKGTKNCTKIFLFASYVALKGNCFAKWNENINKTQKKKITIKILSLRNRDRRQNRLSAQIPSRSLEFHASSNRHKREELFSPFLLADSNLVVNENILLLSL